MKPHPWRRMSKAADIKMLHRDEPELSPEQIATRVRASVLYVKRVLAGPIKRLGDPVRYAKVLQQMERNRNR